MTVEKTTTDAAAATEDLFDKKPAAPAAPAAPAEPVDDSVVMAKAVEAMELRLLKERADQMDITYHPSIGLAALTAKIAAAMNAPAGATEPVAPVVEESIAERNMRYRMEANRLIRVVVNNMNPATQLREGDVFTVANGVIGTIRKFIPFNLEAGYHIPFALYQQLLERKCQVFYTIKDPRTGAKMRKGKLINEFNVVVLPPLTEEELKELATQQALNNSID